MWSVPTGGCSPFKVVQHLESAAVDGDLEGWMKVNGWREGGQQSTIGESTLNPNLVGMAFVRRFEGTNYETSRHSTAFVVL